MATAMRQDALRRALLDQTRAHIVRIASLNALSPEQLAWTPPEGGWGVAQILEHLLTTNGTYLPMMERLTGEATERAEPDEEWKPSLAGGMLIKSMSSPRKFKAPRVFRDVLHPRSGVRQAFIDQLQQLVRLLETADRVSWRRTRTASPVSRLIRLNLGDCYAVLPAHTERHLGQIERVTGHGGFPTSTGSSHATS